MRCRTELCAALILMSGALPRGEAQAAPPDEVDPVATRIYSGIETEYRWFHQHPELSNQETKTAERLATRLREIGLTVTTGVGGTGLVGVLRGRGSGTGPTVLYRADMDGLPVKEATGVAYASSNPGIMHACGHDVHMAVALGTLTILSQLRDTWSGTVVFVGQPAEEIGAGARAMLADPKMKKVLRSLKKKPSVALALHDAADLGAGSVSLIAGYGSANVDSIDIRIFGKGGHGARPAEAIDPIVIGSEIVMALQTIVSRRLEPGTKAVVTVGSFRAGAKHNIIPPTAELLLTVRSYSDAVRNRLIEEIRRVAVHTARAHAAPRDPVVEVRDEFTPAGYNDPAWTDHLKKVFAGVLGAAKVKTHEPSMGGEDFGRYGPALGIPAVMFKLGAQFPRKVGRPNSPGLHSDRWIPDVEPTLMTGMKVTSIALLDILRGGRP